MIERDTQSRQRIEECVEETPHATLTLVRALQGGGWVHRRRFGFGHVCDIPRSNENLRVSPWKTLRTHVTTTPFTLGAQSSYDRSSRRQLCRDGISRNCTG